MIIKLFYNTNIYGIRKKIKMIVYFDKTKKLRGDPEYHNYLDKNPFSPHNKNNIKDIRKIEKETIKKGFDMIKSNEYDDPIQHLKSIIIFTYKNGFSGRVFGNKYSSIVRRWYKDQKSEMFLKDYAIIILNFLKKKSMSRYKNEIMFINSASKEDKLSSYIAQDLENAGFILAQSVEDFFNDDKKYLNVRSKNIKEIIKTTGVILSKDKAPDGFFRIKNTLYIIEGKIQGEEGTGQDQNRDDGLSILDAKIDNENFNFKKIALFDGGLKRIFYMDNRITENTGIMSYFIFRDDCLNDIVKQANV